MATLTASQRENDRTRQIIDETFANALGEYSIHYIVVYGYSLKVGLISKRLSNFIIGFQSEEQKMVVIPIDAEGLSVGTPVNLERRDIMGSKKIAAGSYRIEAKQLKEPLEITVPSSLPDKAIESFQLPINQQREASLFVEFMRKF